VITALRAGADFDVTFVPWTMSQGYRADGALDTWDDPTRDPEHLALAVSTSIRDSVLSDSSTRTKRCFELATNGPFD